MSYEFTQEQNGVITNLANYMRLTAYVTVIVGIIDLLDAISKADYLSIVFSLAIIAIGLAFYFPIDNLKRIVETEGSDIKELLQAFSDLNKGWTIVLGILILAAFFSILNSILSLI